MAWFKVDDSFESHPKVKRIPRSKRGRVVGLWTLAGSWCARQLTDGHLDAAMVQELGGSKSDAAELVRVGLWETTTAGFVFHDWLDWQPSRARVEADRHAAAERQRRARNKAKSQRDTTNHDTDASRRDSRDDMSSRHGPPDPTRPDLTNSPIHDTSPSASTNRPWPVDNPPPSTAPEHHQAATMDGASGAISGGGW